MRLRERSRIVLMASEGKTNRAIAEELRTHTDKVGRWRRRYADGFAQNGWTTSAE